MAYDTYIADFGSEFHDIREAAAFAGCLDPGSNEESQPIAEKLLEDGSWGITYPTVRNEGGTCLACLRPALVSNVRKGETVRFEWNGTERPIPK